MDGERGATVYLAGSGPVLVGKLAGVWLAALFMLMDGWAAAGVVRRCMAIVGGRLEHVR